MDIIRYRGALTSLMEERFGAILPPSHQAAVGVALLAVELVPADKLATFLRITAKTAEEAGQPHIPESWSYSIRLSRLLSQAAGGFDKNPGLQEAWALMQIMPDLLPGAVAGEFLRIAEQALDELTLKQPSGPRRIRRSTVPAAPPAR